ncbi:DUF4136 domain-containing protein [Rheinheimera metallidurans]|uniref:DUF4136 domain-containing protein n=1 Tax=Rheinheimera metallidurans TaxID=2925781 RepID=UPI003003A125
MLRKNIKYLLIACTVATSLLLASCASGPSVRTDTAANTNFSGYKTFSFMAEPATDSAGYTSLITQHFKDAINNEMTALGYKYSETNADLIINFNSNVENRTEVRSTPSASINYGYYNYRRGIYAGFPIFANDVDTIHYKHGTVNIDVIDSVKKQLVWEGISEGTLKNSDLKQPKQAIAKVVGLIFQQYPTQPTAKP